METFTDDRQEESQYRTIKRASDIRRTLGREEAIEKTRERAAYNLKKMEIPLEDIEYVTGLSIDHISQL